MPFAGFKDFAACQASMTKKYKGNKETAKKVCGKLQAQKEASLNLTTEAQTSQFLDKQKVEAFKDEKGDLFIKFFLLDDSVNINDWGVSQRSIPQKIGSAVNKPLVLYIDKGDEPDAHIHKRKEGMANHPVLAISSKGETKEHADLNQELNRIGNIDEVVRDPKNGWWYGIGRITDKGVREAFESDPAGLPFFTSSSIWNNQPALPRVVLDASGNPISVERPDESQIEDWEFMHVALVDEPAYGVEKTHITGRCTGDSNKCVMHLRNASIAKNNGEAGCGFCTKGAMQQIANSVREQGLEEVALGAVNTSHKSTLTQENSVRMDANNQNSENKNVKTTEETKVVEEKKTETAQQQPQQNQNSPAEKKEQVGEPNQQLAASLIEKLTNENTQLKTLLETQTTLTKSIQQKLAMIDEERAKEKEERRIFDISNVVYGSKVYKHLPREEQEKLVQKYAAAQMTGDTLKEFIAPFETVNATHYAEPQAPAQKTASISQVPSKLDYPAQQKVASAAGGSDSITYRKPKYQMISEHLGEVGI
jgi:hypothetical protein